MSHMKSSNENPTNHLPGMNLAVLIDDQVDDQTIRQIRSITSTTSVYDAAVEFPKSDARLKNIANRLLTGEIDVVVFLTVAALDQFVSICSTNVSREQLLNTMKDIKTVAVGPLIAERMQNFGIQPTVELAKSRSWRDVLLALESKLHLPNMLVAVENGPDIYSLSAGLEARGASVVRIDSLAFERVDPSSSEQDLLDAIEDRQLDAILLPNPLVAARFSHLIHHRDRKTIRENFRDLVVLAMGNDTAQLLQGRGMASDVVISDELETQLPGDIRVMHGAKVPREELAELAELAESTMDKDALWYDNPFMRAIRMEPNDVVPVWMMRQAGRYMKEYRAVREKVGFLELCRNSQLCSEVMCTAVEKLGVDAAIIFSDLLVILEPMGCDLEFVKGGGPVIHNPIRESADIDRIKPLESIEPLEYVMETVRQTRKDLPPNMPLIGFAGAPFTLASYMIEGGSSRNYEKTKTLMYTDPGAWRALMLRLVDSIILYLEGQAAAGAQCLQLFDSWAGCLGYDDYVQFVHPYVDKIIDRVSRKAPIINFATANPALLPLLADTNANVIGIDWRIRLDEAWSTVGFDRAVQGNLDPVVLFSDVSNIRLQVQNVLNQAAGRPGHIFNLGHGILPQTPVENAIALVDAVHELSQKR